MISILKITIYIKPKKRSFNAIMGRVSYKQNKLAKTKYRSKLSLSGEQSNATAKPQWKVSGLQLPYFINIRPVELYKL